MPEALAKPISGRKPLLAAIGLGLLLMLGSAASYVSENPSLIRHQSRPAGGETSAAAGPSASAGQNAAMPDAAAQDGVMRLMQRLQQNPQDQEALISLTEHFMHLQDWSRAETFVLRALMAAPGAHKPQYLLGVIQHNQNRHGEAAVSLEKALAGQEDPSIRYSLGILYAYYLEKPEQGIAELQKALDNPTAPANLKKAVQDEIEKIKKHQEHTPQPGTN